jgi:hypothetical protein
VHAAAAEACNGIDDNCNNETDEGFGLLVCGKGECVQEIPACLEGVPQSCDPFAGAAEEICDGFDNDCDGLVDEDEECDCERVEHGEVAYLFCHDLLSWEDARDACSSRGYSLVSIESSEENTFIGQEAWERVTEYWWIGFNDREQEGTYVWAESSVPVTYTSWADSEPNDANGEEDCVTTDYAFIGGWNDISCSALLPYVCEEG